MLRIRIKLAVIALFIATGFYGQNKETGHLTQSEFDMTFPSIYFVNNSTEYAIMPYTVDSCFKFITYNVGDIVSYVIWRDSSENKELTKKRIKKIKIDLDKYMPGHRIEIESMGGGQKISRETITKAIDKKQMQYLLTINSVLDISRTGFGKRQILSNHIEHPRLTCWGCWKNGFHTVARIRLHRMFRQSRKNNSKKS